MTYRYALTQGGREPATLGATAMVHAVWNAAQRADAFHRVTYLQGIIGQQRSRPSY